jgi:hypothetical protein
MRTAILVATPLAVVLAAAADSPTPLLLRDIDVVKGVGLVKAIDSVTVNNAGQWLVEVDTDFADTDADGAVVGPRGLFLREGASLVGTDATVGSFDSVWLNNVGDVGWNLFLDGPPSNQDSGLFINDALLLQEGFLSTAPQFSPGTPYVGFFETRLIDDGRLFVVASVDDPAIATSVDRALVWIEPDGKGGFTEAVLAKEGDVLPDVGFPASDFGTGPETFAVNNAGQALFLASLAGAPTATNAALYLDGALLVQKVDESPVPGFFFSTLSTSARVDLNDAGDWVLATGVSGDAATNQMIVRNGAKVIQKGDPAPGLPGRTITGFNSAPVRIADDGSVFWYGTLDGDAATNQGLWRDDELIVQKGVATPSGLVFSSLSGTTATGGITKGFSISRDGRYLILRGVLDGGTIGAFLFDFGSRGLFGDLDGDGSVGPADLAILLGQWGGTGTADLDGNGSVGPEDLALLLGAWG